LLVDPLGVVLKAKGHAADFAEREGAFLLLAPLLGVVPRQRQLWADRGYRGPILGGFTPIWAGVSRWSTGLARGGALSDCRGAPPMLAFPVLPS